MTFGPVPPSPDFTTSGWSSSLREKFFFLVGMIILPPFWSWWTLRRGFSERQREVAFTWCTLYLIAVLATWHLMEDRYLAAAYAWPSICERVSMGLAFWLYLRIVGNWPMAILYIIVFSDIFAMLASLPTHALTRSGHPIPAWDSWAMVITLLILAVLHLVLDRTRRLLRRCDAKIATWFAKYNLRWR